MTEPTPDKGLDQKTNTVPAGSNPSVDEDIAAVLGGVDPDTVTETSAS